MRYPAFILAAVGCVLTFFLLFVLPQFASVLRGFQAKLDPIVVFFLGLSDLVRSHGDAIAVGSAIALTAAWLLARRAGCPARDLELDGKNAAFEIAVDCFIRPDCFAATSGCCLAVE